MDDAAAGVTADMRRVRQMMVREVHRGHAAVQTMGKSNATLNKAEAQFASQQPLLRSAHALLRQLYVSEYVDRCDHTPLIALNAKLAPRLPHRAESRFSATLQICATRVLPGAAILLTEVFRGDRGGGGSVLMMGSFAVFMLVVVHILLKRTPLLHAMHPINWQVRTRLASPPPLSPSRGSPPVWGVSVRTVFELKASRRWHSVFFSGSSRRCCLGPTAPAPALLRSFRRPPCSRLPFTDTPPRACGAAAG
jgi:hypothetical protein